MKDLILTQISSDFVINESKEQDIELVLKSNKGQWYQFPEIGINLRSFLNGNLLENRLSLEREISEQLSLVGIMDFVIKSYFEKGKLIIFVNNQKVSI